MDVMTLHAFPQTIPGDSTISVLARASFVVPTFSLTVLSVLGMHCIPWQYLNARWFPIYQ